MQAGEAELRQPEANPSHGAFCMQELAAALDSVEALSTAHGPQGVSHTGHKKPQAQGDPAAAEAAAKYDKGAARAAAYQLYAQAAQPQRPHGELQRPDHSPQPSAIVKEAKPVGGPQPLPVCTPSPAPPFTLQLPEVAPPCSTSSSEELAPAASRVPPPRYRVAPESRQAPTQPSKGDRQVGLLYDESMELHVGPEHVEQPLRIIQVYMTLEEEGLLGRCWRLPTQAADDDDLLRAHSPEHIAQIEHLFRERPKENEDDVYIHTGLDLYACKDTAAAARMATGCCVEAVKAVLQGHVQAALAVVRPPGHHAECARAQGFCFYNNCAVAARAALAHGGVERVLVLDWDVHHGNGIQEVLWEDPNALYISLHRDPSNFYPYTAGFKHEVGAGPGTGFNINIPWTKRGMVDADYMAAFDMVVEPVIQSYKPDLVIVAAGFDAAKGDPLGGCRLTPQGYASMTKRLMACSGGKIVLALEGGYNTRITADCAAACTRVLLGESLADIARARAQAESFEQDECCMVMEPKEREVPLGEVIKTLKQVAAIQAQYWPVLQEEQVEARWKAHEKGLQALKRRK